MNEVQMTALLILIIIGLTIYYFIKSLPYILGYLMNRLVIEIGITNKGVWYFQTAGLIFWFLSLIGFFLLDPDSMLQLYAALTMLIIAPIYILLWSFVDVLKHCSWCNRRNIEFIDGHKSHTYKHVNKDGSRDLRRSSNEIYSFYVSKYECSDCGAVTEFVSKFAKNPNRYTKTVSRYLDSSGKGKRIGVDFHNVFKSK